MRKLIMWNLITLDGYFEGEQPWELPWHQQVWGEELERFVIEQLRTTDALLFGRATYEGMAAYWRSAEGKNEGEVADYMNRLPKLVCSRTLQNADWNNSTLISDDVPAAVAQVKQRGDGNIFLFGSANLATTLIGADLFDEYRIGIAPVLYGRGRLLFGPQAQQRQLRLVETRSTATGCTILRYQRDGATTDSP